MAAKSARELQVVIADDDAIVLAGIDALLSMSDDITIVARCRSLPDVLTAVEEHSPDVVMTDIRMPPNHDNEGIEVASRLRATHPDIGVVVLSQFVDPDLALAVLADGSRGRGYLLKEQVSNGDYLIESIRTVAQGGSFIDNDVLDALVKARSGSSTSQLASLTAREIDVLSLMAEGRSNAAIGESLFVGERSVEKHISSIFTKLGLRNESTVHRRVTAVVAYLAEQRASDH